MLDYSREFIVLADCLSYTKASAKLNVSQPSLSRHIADLEKELGFPLLERNPLALTPVGRYYLESICDIIDRLDEVCARGRGMVKKDEQDFSLYMLPSNSRYSSIVYESIANMRDGLEKFSPRICYADRTHSVFDAVVSGKADVGVLLNEPPSVPEGFGCTWLADSPVMAWVHEDNPVLSLPAISLKDLADCYLVRSTTQSALTWYDGMVALLRKNGLEPKFRLKDLENRESFFLALRPDEVLLASDEGESLCPYNSRLVGVRLDDPNMVFSVHLLYRCQPEFSRVMRFVETCHAVAER